MSHHERKAKAFHLLEEIKRIEQRIEDSSIMTAKPLIKLLTQKTRQLMAVMAMEVFS